MRLTANLLLPFLLLSSCGTMPLPDGDPPVGSGVRITAAGPYIVSGGERWYGGSDVTLTLNNAPVDAGDITWSSSAELSDASETKVTVPYSRANRARLDGAPVTVTAYLGDKELASLTLRIDDAEPETVNGVYGIWPGGMQRVLNPEMYIGAGVTFSAKFTDTGVGMAVPNVDVPLQAWRNGIKQRQVFTNTSELLEAGHYEIRAAVIEDRLGNRAGEDPQLLATFHTDYTAPEILSSVADGGVIVAPTEANEEGELTIVIQDPVLADGFAGSDVASVKLSPNINFIPGSTGRQVITMKHSDFIKAGLVGQVPISVDAVDGAGNAASLRLTVRVMPPVAPAN